MRRFYLRRLEDETGISGVGIVTEGYEMAIGGLCIMRWLTDTTSIAMYSSIEDVEIIHGHGGKTVVEWDGPDAIDPADAPMWVFNPWYYLIHARKDLTDSIQ